MKTLTILASIVALTTAGVGCSDTTTNNAGGGGGLSGHIYWVSSADNEIHKLDLGTGDDAVLGFGHAVDKAPDGKLIVIGRTGIEESDESLVSTRVIKKSDFNAKDSAEVNQTLPKVSPDGTKIAYQTLSDSSFVCNRTDGTVVGRFEASGGTDGYLDPNWTPDGRLVIAGGYGNPGLFLTDATLKNPARFDPNLQQPKNPKVSPDGAKVAFVLKNLVYVIGIDGTGLTQIDPTTESADDRYPTWSPDGSRIAYFTKGGHIVIRPAAGGDAVDVFDVYPALADKLLVMSSTVSMQWTE
jgi:Tol biopolymer transport system component